jgi:VanZ family protein
MRRDLTLAIAASLAIILGSPYIGQIRESVQAALPGQYRVIVASIVIGASVAAIVAAIARIRQDRLRRYLYLAAAFGLAAAYAAVTRTGNADRDWIERFHFVQYGLVTYLFYRVWRRRADRAALVLPACAGLVVGILDEWFQWFVPVRVGEFHDVLINGVAVGCGILFSVGVNPLERSAGSRDGRRVIAAAATAVVLTAAAFIESVHLGNEVRDPRVGTFRSQFDAEALSAAATDRAARWRTSPPDTPDRIAREDHYRSEGQWHVQRRNQAWSGADRWRAWHENLILETFFGPVLDLGSRWPPEQRAEAEAVALADRASYISDAEPYPIVALRSSIFWALIAVLLAGIGVLSIRRAPPVSGGIAV